MKISIQTLGCRINQAESSQMGKELQNAGHYIVDIDESPDMCIINTCAVTAKANAQSRQLVNKALKSKAKVIVTGCYAELNHEKLKDNINVNIVRNELKSNIINMIPVSSSTNTLNSPKHLRNRPIVKVQEGCNNSCSYCVIPKVRGKSRSLSVEKILMEIEYYQTLNFKEVVISGIHLGQYGYDLNPRISLSTLLKKILIKTTIPRIRLSSLEIKEINDDFLDVMTDGRICNHVHVPLQSGDNNILKLMNRTYSLNEYISKIDKIVNVLPGTALGTDVIVGFPGEGEIEFNNTLSLVRALPFSYIHVFPYSARPGTKSESLGRKVSESLKKERVTKLREIGISKKKKYIENHIGNTLDIIVENDKINGMVGTTRNYIKVHLMNNGKKIVEGMLIDVRLSGYKNDMAIGSPV